MKKLLSAFLGICACAISAQAQVTVKPGIRAGLNLSKLTDTDFDYQPNFYAGGFLAIKLSKIYTLQPEITYSAQGAKANITYQYDDIAQDGHATQHISIGYLSFGIINKFTFNDAFDIHFGPAIDFQTDSNVSTNSDVDLTFMAGLGCKLPYGFGLEARVKKGIIDVLDSDNYNGYNNYVGNWNTNVVFQLGLNYSFDAKGTTK